jgi:transposase-like protein
MKSIVTLLVLVCWAQADAQLLGVRDLKENKESYFISFDNDTIHGEVEYAKPLLSNRLRKIYFIDSDDYRYTLRAKHSNGFMMDGTFYLAKMVDEMYYFLRPAVTGSPALFVLEKNYVKQERHSLAMMRAEERDVKVIDYFIESKGAMHKLYEKRFKKQAPRLFEAFPEVVEMIALEEFTFKDIEEIIYFCNYSNDGLSEEIGTK